VEVISPAYKFDPVRVDITSKGKMRWGYPVYFLPKSGLVRMLLHVIFGIYSEGWEFLT
jgi:hypothetical protein